MVPDTSHTLPSFSDRQRPKTAANGMTMTPLFYLMTMSIERFGILKGGGVNHFIGLVWQVSYNSTVT
jgi:hypothetical protein